MALCFVCSSNCKFKWTMDERQRNTERLWNCKNGKIKQKIIEFIFSFRIIVDFTIDTATSLSQRNFGIAIFAVSVGFAIFEYLILSILSAILVFKLWLTKGSTKGRIPLIAVSVLFLACIVRFLWGVIDPK